MNIDEISYDASCTCMLTTMYMYLYMYMYLKKCTILIFFLLARMPNVLSVTATSYLAFKMGFINQFIYQLHVK